MDKWHYLRLVSKASDAYGSELVKMMDKYEKDNLLQITLEEAEEYYEKLKKINMELYKIGKPNYL